MPHRRSDLVIRLIAVFKLIKAGTLIALGLGALSLRHGHSWVSTWIHALAADARGKYISEAVAKITAANPRTLVYMGVGSMIYAAVFLVEGIGLMLKKSWAEWLTVIVTISFIPLEIYEMVEKASVAKAIVIMFNIAIVVYLIRRRRREHRPATSLQPVTSAA
ncbi:MAG TPA: DUF2127 domain-containing protein [Kofleriaceae bacterium]|nr:DUF2127 domain-containing protein [Kofleriaceae bacterium]